MRSCPSYGNGGYLTDIEIEEPPLLRPPSRVSARVTGVLYAHKPRLSLEAKPDAFVRCAHGPPKRHVGPIVQRDAHHFDILVADLGKTRLGQLYLVRCQSLVVSYGSGRSGSPRTRRIFKADFRFWILDF